MKISIMHHINNQFDNLQNVLKLPVSYFIDNENDMADKKIKNVAYYILLSNSIL